MLIHRYRQSIESVEIAEEYYEQLSEPINIDDIARWKTEITNAEKERLSNRAVMDMMASRLSQMKKSQVPEVESDVNKGNSWIGLGLSMEERQWVSSFDINGDKS